MNTQLSSIFHPPSSLRRCPQASPSAFRTPHSALRTGFTLIELLVVISIIALLAALIFPITGAVNRSKLRAKARAELAQVQTAIDSYKAKLGHYPPDNPRLPATNQLYFELLGTLYTNVPGAGAMYLTLDRSAQIADDPTAFSTVFGPAGSPNPNVAGFVNCSKGGGEEVAKGVAFLNNLRSGQSFEPIPTLPGVKVLTCSVPLPDTLPAYFGKPKVNPFCYNSSNPTNNPNSYDLWVDVVIDGKINRICNWSQQPLIVSQPW